MSTDVYIWSVIYTDGSVMCEYDNAEGRGFVDVDASRVKALDIEPLPEALAAHRVMVPAGATPVFFRRRSIALSLDSTHQAERGTVHCIGWRHGERGVYLFVFEDGSALLSDDLQAV